MANYAYGGATGSTFTDDAATQQSGDGGAIFTSYRFTLTGSTLSADTAGSFGGGVYNNGKLTATGDTLSADSAPYGGGIDTSDATLTNDTLVDDTASQLGGGVLVGSLVIMTDDTVSHDTAPSGAGLYAAGNTSSIATSILSDAGCTFESGAVLADDGYNVESDNTCKLGTDSKVDSTSIQLASGLAANGSTGPQTLAIPATSSAVKEVPAADCTVTTDERGDPRPGYSGQTACDAGAYELQYKPTVPSAPRSPHAVAGVKALTVSWKAPSSTGGLALTGYRVYCGTSKHVSTAGAGSAKSTAKTLSAKISKLKAGKTYYCVVTARNAKGGSPPSATVSAKPRA